MPAFREYVGRKDFPCVLMDLAGTAAGFMVMFHLARIYRLIIRIQFNKVLAKTSYKKVSDETKLNTGSPLNMPRTQSTPSISNDSEKGTMTHSNFAFQNPLGKGFGWNDLDTLVLLLSTKFQTVLFLFFSALILVNLSTAVRFDRVHCLGCESNEGGDIYIIVISALFGLLMLRALWYIRKEPDVLGLYSELYYSSGVFLGVATFYLFFALPDAQNLNKDGEITWSYFLCIGYLMSFSIILPKQIIHSFFMEAHESRVNHLGLSAILNSEIGINYFKIHMIHELSIESILFWQNAMAWKNAYRTTSVLIREENYIRIFKTFIEHGSIMQINISYDTYEAVLRDADRSKNIPETVFDECMQQAVYLMSSNAYPRFIRSELYQKYLTAAKGEHGVVLENEGYV